MTHPKTEITKKNWNEVIQEHIVPVTPDTIELCEECGLPIEECNRRYYERKGWRENPETGMIELKPKEPAQRTK